jgi:hypothetical protein
MEVGRIFKKREQFTSQGVVVIGEDCKWPYMLPGSDR